MNSAVILAVAVSCVLVVPYLAFGLLYLVVSPSGSPAAKRSSEPTVSIIIPTYNESALITEKLSELVELDYPNEKIEIVIADESDDATPELVREFFSDRDQPSYQLRHNETRRGVAPAVNDAFQAASGDVAFRTDADSKLAENVLREAVANLADPEVGAVTGVQSEVLGESAVEADYRGIQSVIQAVESHLDSTFVVHGPCFAIDADAFVPIDEGSLADDSEIGVRIRRAGKRVVVDPAMQFIESGSSSFTKRRTRKDRRAMGLVKLLVQFRDMLGSYGRYGRIVLPFNWWFMIVTPWLLAVEVVLVTAAVYTLGGGLALLVPLSLLVFGYLGQSELLGPLQPFHALLDSQVSLLIAAIRLLTGEDQNVWEVDRESREVFK